MGNSTDLVMQLFAGSILYEPHDIKKTIEEYNAAYQKLLIDGHPKELTPQQMVFNSPQGRLFGVIFTWSSEDTETGRLWCKKIDSLGKSLMNTISETTIPQWHQGNAGLVPAFAYGIYWTHNLHEITPEIAACLGSHLEKMPEDPCTLSSIH